MRLPTLAYALPFSPYLALRVEWGELVRILGGFGRDGQVTPLLPITETPHCRSPKFPRQPDGVEGLI